MSKKKEQKECAYCGKIRKVTRDHVIPRAFFETQPSNPIIVPSCSDCNTNKKGRLDPVLRDYLALDFHGSRHPEAKKLLEGKLLRSIQNNHSLVAKQILQQGKPFPIFSPGGIYIGDGLGAPIDDLPIQEAVFSIARGCFYDAMQMVLPENYHVALHRLKPKDFMDMYKDMEKTHSLRGPRFVGNVAAVSFANATEDPCSSYWLMSFYGYVALGLGVYRPDLYEKHVAKSSAQKPQSI